jgi:RimJ/RimL family protein N-acetyltransferase
MIVFNDITHGEVIANRCGFMEYNSKWDKCFSVTNREYTLLGGVILTRYTGKGGSIAMHVAGFHPKWLKRDFIWTVFQYTFEVLGCNKVFGEVPAQNKRALQFDLKLGFSVENMVRDVFPDGHLYLLAMYKDECRWLNCITPEIKKLQEVLQGANQEQCNG